MGHPFSFYTRHLVPPSIHVPHDLSEEPGSPCTISMPFCKTTTLITAVHSHEMNQGSIINILLSTKMITTSYRFISLQLSKSKKCFFKYNSKCCSIGQALTSLLHNLMRHYNVQRSFRHLPIRGKTNPGNISHSIYII